MRNIEEDEDSYQGEMAFRKTSIPPWNKQITLRAVVISFVLSIIFSFIVCNLNFTTGVMPSLNIAAGFMGFAAIKSYTTMLNHFGILRQPFTRQENIVIQTCVIASSGITFNSGIGSYLIAMSPAVASQISEGNTPINTKQPSPGWLIGFLFVVSFVGLFSIVPLRKLMILKYKLTYPSGTATAVLINSLHTPKGAKLAKKQVVLLFKSFCGSFSFAGFQWLFAAADGCGFSNFPIFGLQAYKHRFYFDFSCTYVGVGMLIPYMVNISLLLGAIISWGILWPWIEQKKGIWYSADLSPSSLYGIQGYRVFGAIGLMLGDGLYHCISMLGQVVYNLRLNYSKKNELPSTIIDYQDSKVDYDDQLRKEYFLKDQIPIWVAWTGYVILAIISIMTVSHIFPQLKWYHILVTYLIAPILAFCNAYGCGLSDWSLASGYGKVSILIFSAWVGLPDGGIVAGLASCGVMMNIVSTASDLMQDFKSGYLTLASPRSMFFSQIIGTAMGCVISPVIFMFLNKDSTIGDPEGKYPAPYGQIYRGLALLGTKGFSILPKHCLELTIILFFSAMIINIIHDVLLHYETKYRLHRFVPNPMCLAIPFYLGGHFVIDMCIGNLIIYLWDRKNKHQCKDYAPALASGLICGDSSWNVPAAMLSYRQINPPICMKFLSAPVNQMVDTFLSSGHT
ncbi:hypothetical protein TanjilG_21307 [Lupinus angustifolius]|uniref:Metal-nicotianamine transporter YSL7 n=1 Tax=Lupinus angustifolius TaxID=3871 RepID=A0A4P1RMH2_LUPAN|nr:PREDICTED: probable metal-nicotianamine transporter YSL7 [Lupinus angustifolius]OIW14167.1 hypothetical protein TanjilG_21307 [Lupinus angustifolius]